MMAVKKDDILVVVLFFTGVLSAMASGFTDGDFLLLTLSFALAYAAVRIHDMAERGKKNDKQKP